MLIAGPDNRVRGNSIGTDPTGLLALGNRVGVLVTNTGNTIGGSGAGEGNLISGNLGDGVDILGSGATGNTLEGNVIGLDSSQGDSVGNGGVGVLIGDQASDNLIGVPARARATRSITKTASASIWKGEHPSIGSKATS